ncbi:MAG: hypothetical protein ACJAZM_002609 [Cyclobacteriaceae bacterium]|jgi:hypothetical protein
MITFLFLRKRILNLSGIDIISLAVVGAALMFLIVLER